MNLKRFEVLYAGKVHRLFHLAKKAKRKELESYIQKLLDNKSENAYTLIYLDAFEASQSSADTNPFEKHIATMTPEQKRQQWREAKRRQKDAFLRADQFEKFPM